MPMTIYKFAVCENQEWIFPVNAEDFETFFAMDGRAIHEWAPPVMRLLEAEDEAEEPSYSDFPWLGEHAPILKKPAVEALTPVLARYGQLLPLKGEDVWLFNVTNILDALDKERSGIVYFDDGDILDIERYVFKEEIIGSAEIFKLPTRGSTVYVNDGFVKKVRGSGLRGVSFVPLDIRRMSDRRLGKQRRPAAGRTLSFHISMPPRRSHPRHHTHDLSMFDRDLRLADTRSGQGRADQDAAVSAWALWENQQNPHSHA